jgi:alkyl hydroperoxide reductase subunit AhpC
MSTSEFTPRTPLAPGTPAPDFRLPSTPEQKVSPSDFIGQPVILAFYPADWRRCATTRWRSIRRHWLQVNRLDWYIMNGFVSDELLCLMDAIKSGAVIGQINWA